MKIAKKDLKNIEVELTEKGFVIWVGEKKKINGKMKTIKHWLLDGGLLKEDGEVRIGKCDLWKIKAKYSEEENSIKVTRE